MDTEINCRQFQRCNKSFPQVSKPKIVGYFSLNSQRIFEANCSQLNYYKPPPVDMFPLDLNMGISKAIVKTEDAYDEHLDNLLKFLYDYLENRIGGVEVPLVGSEFVCWRGTLTSILVSPYEQQENYVIDIIKYMGTFYLSVRDTNEKKWKRSQETEFQRKTCRWGYKFEQYCLVKSPFQTSNINAPVNECSSFQCVFRTKLANHNLLYGAEMDGILSANEIDLSATNLSNVQFVELKTRQQTLNLNQQRNFDKYKSHKWWCQSYLVGIQDIYVGLRDNNGMVQRIQHCDVRSLAKTASKYEDWSAAASVYFLDHFLNHIKNVMANVNCPYTTYGFSFIAKYGKITYEISEGKNKNSFLPDWYIEKLKRMEKNRAEKQ